MSNKSIEITDVGPINRLRIAVPDGGGIIVLRGCNGTGKTTALQAAEALVRGSGSLETRDGASVGRVDGLGATLVLGRRTTRAGEIEVSSLEGRLNISDLVDPHMKDQSAADRQRIKALVSLAGTEPTQAQFAAVIGEKLASYISQSTWASKDLLDVAAKAKRDLESAARQKETESVLREGQAKAAAESVAGVDLNAPHDEQVLRDAHSAASVKYSRLEQQNQSAEQAQQNIAQAQKNIEAIRSGYSGPTIADAKAAHEAALAKASESAAVVRELESKLADAKVKLNAAMESAKAAARVVIHAQEFQEMIGEYEKILLSVAPQPIPQAEMDQASKSVQQAAEAIELGAIVRRAINERSKAEECRKMASAAATEAANLRIAASQIDDVLSRAVACEQLAVRDGRLYYRNHKRGEVLFDELSEGERWTLAFDVAAPFVGKNGLLVLPQMAFESLDPTNRAHVANLARQHQIVVLTAEATDGELRSEAL